MYLRGSIFLIVLGAILRYAVADSFDSVDLPMVGLILMIGGAIGLVLAIAAGTALTIYADFPVPIGIGVGIGAHVFSAVIGLLFVGYPAVRPSRLSPIEALRSE